MAKQMRRIRRGGGSGRRPKGGGGAKAKASKAGKRWAPPHGSGRDFGKADRVPRNTKRF